jgi:hypothetical protein
MRLRLASRGAAITRKWLMIDDEDDRAEDVYLGWRDVIVRAWILWI